MKELNDLNNIYQKMYVTEVSADKALEASKKADVERGKAAVAGDKERAKAKAGQAARLYKAQAKKRLNKEDYETKKKSEVLGAMKKQGRKLSDKEKNKIADNVVKDKGDTSKSDDRYAYESVGSDVDKTLGAAGEIADTAIKLPAKAVGYLKGLKKGIKKAAKKGETKANEEFERRPIY